MQKYLTNIFIYIYIYLEAKKLIKDLITSWIGIFGPGCGPTQLFASSGVTITGGTVFVEPDVEGQLWHTGDSMASIFILVLSIIRVHKIIKKYYYLTICMRIRIIFTVVHN